MLTQKIFWRDKIKAGPFSEFYTYVRWAKRRILGERIEVQTVEAPELMTLEILRELGETMPDHARLYFSLALAYIAEGSELALRRSLANIRCAAFYRFESQERLDLYQAELLAKLGYSEEAFEIAHVLDPQEFTTTEQALHQQILTEQYSSIFKTSVPCEWQAVEHRLQELCAKDALTSILALEDIEAWSAHWLPNSNYLLASKSVNGLSLDAVARGNLQFDAAFGPPAAIDEAQKAGINCRDWIIVGQKF